MRKVVPAVKCKVGKARHQTEAIDPRSCGAGQVYRAPIGRAGSIDMNLTKLVRGK